MIKKVVVVFLFVLLGAYAFLDYKKCNSISEVHKTELKYLIPDLSKIPHDIIQSLEKGEEHQDILKRGFVVQDYLAVTRKNIFNVYRSVLSAEIPFGNEDQIKQFSMPGKVQEIRFMRKCIKEDGVIKEVFQVAIQGRGDMSNAKMDTPEFLNEDQLKRMKKIFNTFSSEVNDRVCKLYFEMPLKDIEDSLVIDSKGNSRTVEVDVFFKNRENVLTPFFINGEVKFREKEREEALLFASNYRLNTTNNPSYFGADVTNKQGLKSRSIALAGMPKDIEEHDFEANTSIINQIANQFKDWTFPEINQLIFSPSSKQIGIYLNKKVLVNAESFGFGPSAAISEIFPYLRNRISHLSYIGTGHTLDLQRKLPYDEVFDYGEDTSDKRKEKFIAIAKDFDIFITASDFETARWAKEQGLNLVIYDPLTWYWKQIPEIIGEADFYVAQNFLGVEKRLQDESTLFPDYAIVPPIISGIHDKTAEHNQQTLLVNMGGLSNPYMSLQDLEHFAKTTFSVIYNTLDPLYDVTNYLSSKSIVETVQEICPAKTLQPQEVQDCLSASNLAIMTSGLGNIYEASSMSKKVIWLPPANDSQGQQISLLRQHKMADYSIDWSDIFIDEEPIDYFSSQEVVMSKIATYMKRLSNEPKAKARFTVLLCVNYEEAQSKKSPRLAKLTDMFEVNGAKQAAECILQNLR
jgi:hypothetical protein